MLTWRTPSIGEADHQKRPLSWHFPLWAQMDLNHRPHPYQGCALTELSYGPEIAVRQNLIQTQGAGLLAGPLKNLRILTRSDPVPSRCRPWAWHR
jgi:hypothetical protein